MGIVRLLLALSVVAAHSTEIAGFSLVGGRIAVQMFYIISGFYMSLILSEKYIGQGSYRIFIVNRFLRLYPVFWAVCIVALICAGVLLLLSNGEYAGVLQPYLDYLRSGGAISLWSWAVLLGSNIFLFGQDAIMFLGMHTDSGNLFFVRNFLTTDPKVYHFLLIPQGWTIGVELLFYVIAPFIVRKNIRLILGIIAVSLCLRWYLYSLGLDHDPWTHRLFPLELAFFLFGTVAYRVYTSVKEKVLSPFILPGSLLVVIVGIIVFPFISGQFKELLYFGFFAALLPFMFMSTNQMKWDTAIGELSYPVYISHLFVQSILIFMPFYKGEIRGALLALSSIAFAVILNIVITKPIERLRKTRAQKLLLKNKGIIEVSAW